jgi:hypothetical protein
MFAPLVVAGVLVVIVGLAGVAFWLNRASGPTGPAKVRQAETVTAGKPAVDGTSTTTGTGSQNLEPGKSGQKPGEQEKPVADAEASTPDQSKSSPASAGDATQPQAAGSPDPEPPPSKPPAQRQAQARQSVVDESAVRHPHKPAQEPVYNPPVSYSPSTPRAEEPQPPEEPSSPPTHALQMHPKFSRIQQARTKLDELKGRGIDVTTSRQLLDAVETLAVRGDSPALEAKLQDLEYRLGLRASKD